MTPRIVARLGARGPVPENTFAAAHAAARDGADLVAVDVRESRDGVFHLLHDATVDRTTDGTGALDQLDSGEIDRLDAGARFGAAYVGEPVPRLDRFLAALRGRVDFLLTLRHGDPGALGRLLREVGLDRRSLVHLVDPADAAALAAAAPDLLRVVDLSGDTGAAAARAQGARVVRLPADAAAGARVDEARRAGLDVLATPASDDPAALRAALASGARLVETDRPDAAEIVRRRLAFSV